MDFRLTPEQLELQDHVRQYCARTFTREHLSTMDGPGIDRAGWSALGDLGVFALRLPEARGGLGLGWVETVAVYEVLGHWLVPGPLVWTQLLAGVVDGASDGTRMVTGLDRVDPGAPPLVEYGHEADVIAVIRPDGAVVLGAPPASEPNEAFVPLDPLTPVAVVPAPDGRVLAGVDGARLRVEGAVLAGALLTGIAGRALEAAREYALEREQFGRPIAAFQAIQHLLADMYVRVMLARSAAHAAAAILDDPTAGDAAASAASVKVVAGDAAMANARACIQVHGGMGFTWEMIPHYLLKRTWVLEHGFGTPFEHAEALAARLGAPA